MNKKIYLLPLYLIARLLKCFLFWIPISNFNRWKNEKEVIQKDLIFLTFISIIAGIIILFNWYFSIPLVVLFLLIYYAILSNGKR